jgi:hypothetical protein
MLLKDRTVTVGDSEWESIAGMAKVVSPYELPGIGVTYEIADQTSTPTQVDFVSGLLSVAIAYIDILSTDGVLLYVVFDALDDADAATKLALAGSREIVMLGERRQWVFSPDSPCFRIDIASNTAAETGDSLTFFSGKVQA